MDKIIAIISYCNTNEKVNALVENIEDIRKKYPNFDIAIHANYPLSESIQKMVDIYFYSNLNISTDKFVHVWNILPYFDKKFNYYFYNDFGFSVFQQIKFMAEKLIKYKRILLMNYDTILEKEHVEQMESKHDMVLYRWTNNEVIDINLLLMNFNPIIFSNKVSPILTLENYLGIKGKLTEEIFFELIQKSMIDYEVINSTVKDKICNMPYFATKNEYFKENLICFNDNKLEIYLWYLEKNIQKIQIEIDMNKFTLNNENTKAAFESSLIYDKEISTIEITEIDDIQVNIPMILQKNSNAEKI